MLLLNGVAEEPKVRAGRRADRTERLVGAAGARPRAAAGMRLGPVCPYVERVA
ncbi:hypothetical protein San01_66300 [Streptomyces angustmyceticus]|uniref:Uncharacterized protein n=1 Tax=Streptomyces angustmyceticus TaxID=285578 RepID=A0A5J4LQ72_9ACTN|nr:hypothetical protein San01_66300 [Streptomyces angustmyceticus]